jgi:DNA-binding response OmpR family regulator
MGAAAVTFEGAGGVLVVEDNAVLGRAWMRSLTRRGYHVTLATSCAEVEPLLANWAHRSFAYALIDDRLPDGFGADLLPRLAAVRPAPAVALVSGSATTERWLAASKARASIVPKPATDQGLIALLTYLQDALRPAAPPTPGWHELPEGQRLTLTRNSVVGPMGDLRIRRAGLDILAYLLEREGRIVPATELAGALFGRSDLGGTVLIRRHVADLRAALREHRDVISTTVGFGYSVRPGHLRRG